MVCTRGLSAMGSEYCLLHVLRMPSRTSKFGSSPLVVIVKSARNWRRVSSCEGPPGAGVLHAAAHVEHTSPRHCEAELGQVHRRVFQAPVWLVIVGFLDGVAGCGL